MLTIDGGQGEGGGQILRTALSLSMITGHPFTIENVRAGRRKPGLLRQHLTCVKAAGKISRARVEGAHLGSGSLTFEPGQIRGGEYAFAIGSAGSTSLVFQTLLPALLQADAPSHITLSGGTHNSSSPPFDYLERAFLPVLERMGAVVAIELTKHGFYPAGGGQWQAHVTPAGALHPLTLESAGELKSRRVIALVANIPYEVAEREIREAAKLLSWPAETGEARTVTSDGPGNVVMVEIASEHVTEIFTGFGERGMSAETVASHAVAEARKYLSANVPVGPHLADQLLLPLAIAGAGSFVTSAPTEHTATNIAVIEKFLDLEFRQDDLGDRRCRISVTK